MSGGAADPSAPGGIVVADGPLEINATRPLTTLNVVNAGDRPVQVGSHFHFFEANAALEFDREASRGLRLDVPAGTAVRFEPGVNRDVDLVPFSGSRVIPGLRGLTGGALDGAAE